MARYPTALLMCVLLLIAACSGATSGDGSVKIGDVRYETGSLLVEVEAASAAASSRIDILSSQGSVLCSVYKDLAAGANHLEVGDCDVEERIKVTVSPPGGAMSVKDVSLDLPVAKVSVGDVRPERDSLVVELESTLPADKVRMDIVLGADVICTKYFSLVRGSNIPSLDGCEVGNLLNKMVTIAVQPEGGALVTEDVTITAPPLEVREGYRYDYTIASSSWGPLEVKVYSTDLSSSAWEGILGLKNVNSRSASLVRYRIPREGLGLETTSTLSLAGIDEDATYVSVADGTLSSEVMNAVIPLLVSFFAARGLDVTGLMQAKSASFSERGSSGVITVALEETLIEQGIAAHKVRFSPEGTQQPIVLTVSAAAPYLALGGTIPNLGTIMYLGESKASFRAGDYDGYTVQGAGTPVLESTVLSKPPTQPLMEEPPREEQVNIQQQ